MYRFFVTGLCALIASVGSAAAQTDVDSTPQSDAIVVTGKKLPPKAVHRYMRQIIAPIDGQLPRFLDPVCPVVVGMDDSAARPMETRIRKVAAQVGLRPDRADCEANLIVWIARDADALVRSLRAKRPRLFDGVDDTELHRAFRDGPVHLWNATELLNEDNQRQTGPFMYVKRASFVGRPTRRVIRATMVVLDSKALLGKTVTQIADYVAMRAIGGAIPPREGLDADTILTLFDPAASTPYSVTEVDLSYLRGLYRTNPLAHAGAAMGQISQRIRRDAAERGIDTDD